MESKRRFLSFAVLSISLAWALTSRAQTSGPPSSTAPPKFLTIVHQEIKPGKDSAYADLETAIASGYKRENVPVFWLGLQSVTGPSEVLYLNSFNSSEEMANADDALNAALAAHPELRQMQDRLQEENTSSATTFLAVRREDMGYRANTIDLSKMRMLRVSTIFAHPGYERAFMQAEWTLAAACEKVNSQVPWMVYGVISGLPGPTFVILTPMSSLKEFDDSLAVDSAIEKVEGGTVEEELQELDRVAYGTVDTHLFRIGEKMSHISPEFAAGDPDFWNAAAVSSPEPAAAKSAIPAPKRSGRPVPASNPKSE